MFHYLICHKKGRSNTTPKLMKKDFEHLYIVYQRRNFVLLPFPLKKGRRLTAPHLMKIKTIKIFQVYKRKIFILLSCLQKKGRHYAAPNNYENKHLLYLCIVTQNFCFIVLPEEKMNFFPPLLFFSLEKKQGQPAAIPALHVYVKQKSNAVSAKTALDFLLSGKRRDSVTPSPPPVSCIIFQLTCY